MDRPSNHPETSLSQPPPPTPQEHLSADTPDRAQTEQRIKEYVRQAANDLIALADTDVESWPKKQFRDALDFALVVNSAQVWFKEGGYNEALMWVSGAPMEECPDPPNPAADRITEEVTEERKEREERNKTTINVTVEISKSLRQRMYPASRPTKEGRRLTVRGPLSPRVLDAIGMLKLK